MGARLDRAWLLFEQGRYDLAEGEAGQALAEDPENPRVHVLIALARLRAGKSDEALEAAKQTVALAPDAGYAHFVLGQVRSDRDEHKLADASLREAIRLEPEEAEYRWVRGAVLFDWGKRREALEEVDAGLRLDPEKSGLHALRGLILYGLDRVSEAEEAYRTALRIDPGNDMAHAGLGRIEASRGKADAAVDRYREALRLDPNDAWAREGLLDALRARYPVYGLFLRYIEWTRRLSPRTRTVLFIGLYVVFRYAGKAAKDAEGPLQWALIAVAVAYVLFWLLTWIADPLFNLLLRLRPEGRLLLDRDEIAASNLVGLSLLAALICGGAAWWHQSLAGVFAAILFVLVVPATATLFQMKRGGLRTGFAVLFPTVLAAGLAGAAWMALEPESPLGLVLSVGAMLVFTLATWVFSFTSVAQK